MNIVFFGEDSFSNIVLQSLIDSEFDVILVVSPYYDNFIHKRLENTCTSNQIEFIRVPNFSDISFIKKLKSLAPEMIVISHFEKLLRSEIIEIPKFGCINLHPSLLPYYRGMAPQHWPIINGENETGVTVHSIDQTADTGDIILQRKVKIETNMYVSDLQLEFLKIYKSIIVDAINLTQQEHFKSIKQSFLEGSYYGKLKKNQCQISLENSCSQTINLIRGVSKPYFGAFIDDLIIWRAHIANEIESKKIMTNSKLGLNFSEEIGFFLKFKDGNIIIEKHEKKLNENETTNNKYSARDSS